MNDELKERIRDEAHRLYELHRNHYRGRYGMVVIDAMRNCCVRYDSNVQEHKDLLKQLCSEAARARRNTRQNENPLVRHGLIGKNTPLFYDDPIWVREHEGAHLDTHPVDKD